MADGSNGAPVKQSPRRPAVFRPALLEQLKRQLKQGVYRPWPALESTSPWVPSDRSS